MVSSPLLDARNKLSYNNYMEERRAGKGPGRRTGTGTGTERMKAAERRELVLEAAIVEFATYGLHGATTEGIAIRAGITQPYVLRLFRTKLVLFLATVDRVCDRILETWERAAAELPPETDPLARLDHLGLAYIGLIRRREELLLVLQAVAASKEPAVLATTRRRMAEMYGYVERVTGAPDDWVQRFFAQGMLLTVAAGLDLTAIAAEEAWARRFIGPLPPADWEEGAPNDHP